MISGVAHDTWPGPRVHVRTILAAAAVGVVGAGLLLADAANRPALYPLLVGIATMAALVVQVCNRDRRVPVLDLGAFAILTTGIYTTVPLVNFAAGGFKWQSLSDSRLQYWGGTPDQVGAFAWRGVVYLVALTLAYLAFRRTMPQGLSRPVAPPRLLPVVVVLVVAIFALALLETRYGLSHGSSYAQLDVQEEARAAAPLAVQQIVHNLVGVVLLFKLALLLLLMERWSHWKWRAALIAWLATETVAGLSQLGSRTEVVQLWLAAMFAYHRLVQPLTLKVALGCGAVLLLAAVGYGLARDVAYTRPGLGVSRAVPILSATNEFQALFATAYDIHQRQLDGTLDVPPALRFRELYQLVPSQLLPFYKWDAGEWYLTVINEQGKGTGYLFGVVSQALIGWDWIELALRGIVLGAACALLQRWYLRWARNWWVTLSYVFLCLWIYYTFRDTTFAPAYFIVYRLLPGILILRAAVALEARARALRWRLA
jgi:hypothetical protein